MSLHAFINLAAAVGRPVVFFDFEATGLPQGGDFTNVLPVEMAIVAFFPGVDPQEDAQTIEAAQALGPLADGLIYAMHGQVNPGVPIPPESTAVHGITDADVSDCPAWNDPAVVQIWRNAEEAGAIFVGHNIEGFDLPLAKALGYLSATPVFVDTARFAKRLQDDEPKPPCFTEEEWQAAATPIAQAGTLAYFRSTLSALHWALTGDQLEGAHGAMADTIASVRVFSRLLDLWCSESIDVDGHGRIPIGEALAGAADTRTCLDLWIRWMHGPARGDGWLAGDLSDPASITIGKGKHRGVALAKVDAGYLKWLLGLNDIAEPTRAAVTVEMARREFDASPRRSAKQAHIGDGLVAGDPGWDDIPF